MDDEIPRLGLFASIFFVGQLLDSLLKLKNSTAWHSAFFIVINSQVYMES